MCTQSDLFLQNILSMNRPSGLDAVLVLPRQDERSSRTE